MMQTTCYHTGLKTLGIFCDNLLVCHRNCASTGHMYLQSYFVRSRSSAQRATLCVYDEMEETMIVNEQ